MKKLTKIALVGAAILVIGATSVTALAASEAGPGNMMPGYGTRAYAANNTAFGDSDKLDALQAQCLDRMRAVLDAKVADGTMTQAQEDAFLAAMKERQAVCDGTGSSCGVTDGNGFGLGMMGGQTGYGYGMMGGR